VLVGAAGIAANGDLANVIGTCGVASIAAQHGVPVIVCAPLAAVDSAAATGADLATEERPPADVLEYAKTRVAPTDAAARNPVVDVTPASLISGIATEEGFLVAPFGQAIPGALLARAIRLPASAPQAHGLP
jgi:methylthioribose-1-phosphate isomerase